MLKFFGPNFLGAKHPTFLQQVVGTIHCPPLGKVWLISAWQSPSAKPGNEAESKIYVGWAKMQVEF